jgi:hypothetical protein
VVLDRPGDEDDALAKQPGINVEAAFAPVRLLDDDWDELRDDVLMINHGKRILFCCATYIGAKSQRFKAGTKREGRPGCPGPPTFPLACELDQYFRPMRA